MRRGALLFAKTEGGLSTRPDGYRTLVLYRVPRGTRGEAVIRFYEARLGRRGWDSLGISGSVPVANFTRGRALVAVDASPRLRLDAGLTRSSSTTAGASSG